MKTRKKRILVVDDDRTVCETFKEILERHGHVVDVAETGIEALEKLWIRYCDLIIINTKLPDMTGGELETKMHKVMPSTKTIILGIEPVSVKRLLKMVDDLLKKTSQ